MCPCKFFALASVSPEYCSVHSEGKNVKLFAWSRSLSSGLFRCWSINTTTNYSSGFILMSLYANAYYFPHFIQPSHTYAALAGVAIFPFIFFARFVLFYGKKHVLYKHTHTRSYKIIINRIEKVKRIYGKREEKRERETSGAECIRSAFIYKWY